MIYLSVNGDQNKRGALVRDFYQVSLGDKFGQDKFPPVNPDSMANLSDLLETSLSVSDMTSRLLGAIEANYNLDQSSQEEFQHFLASEDFENSFKHQEERMKRRNEIINWEAL